MTDKTVLAIDPGTSKCGMALVRRVEQDHLELLWRGIAPTENLTSQIDEAHEMAPFSLIIIGSGTSGKNAVHRVREHLPSMGILVVDEKDTTLQARERYWEHHKRRGWRRLLPSTMQTPPEPVDDFVALILAERVLLQG
ncbi:MAG: pre-16S rRNA-processing nuclease YqgF [Armatimonadetes bacterium]|nr:pre-16S rRNA-processing nuclease YqgF [Armatimonadota bacterium]